MERGGKKRTKKRWATQLQLNANVARRADKQKLDNKFSVSAAKSMGRHPGLVYSQRKQMSDHMDTVNLSTVCCEVRVCCVLKVDVLFVTYFQVLWNNFSVESFQRTFAFLFDPDGILFLQNLFFIRFYYAHSVLFVFAICSFSFLSPYGLKSAKYPSPPPSTFEKKKKAVSWSLHTGRVRINIYSSKWERE